MKKEILMKYWWVGLLVVALPAIFNLCYLIPAFAEIFEEPKGWTLFWGSYLGVIISGAVAFVVLHKQLEQNHRENNMNRNLQLRTVEYQLKMQWLTELKSKASIYYRFYHHQDIYLLERNIKEGNKKELENLTPLIKKIIEDKVSSEFDFRVLFPQQKDDFESGFLESIEHLNLIHLALMKDLEWLISAYKEGIDYGSEHLSGKYFEELTEDYKDKGYVSEIKDNRIYDIIRDYKYDFSKSKFDIIDKRMQSMKNISQDKLINKLSLLIDYETDKINKILTDGI